jgi:ornithine cyclodeaminase
MPERVQIEHGNKTLLLMPCFTNTILGTKLVTVYPENIQKKQPVLHALMIVNDVELGKPLAVINGSELTALRTGAVGGVSIRHLTSESLTTLGIIGAGTQGFHQALFATKVRNITDIFVYDIQSDKVAKFMMELSMRRPEMIIHQSNSVEELLEQTELIITATTSSNPVLPNKTELLRGKHFVGIGSYKPSMREFPEAIFKVVDRVYVRITPLMRAGILYYR